MKDSSRIVFWGTPQIAAICLKQLAQKYNIVAVVSQPDKPVGRKYQIMETPVKQVAKALGLPVLQPETLKNNTEFFEQLKAYNPDISVILAYGKIMPQVCLELVKHNINLHFSLLPQYRGAAPVQRALLDGKTKTGVTIQHVVYQLDCGDIILQQELPIEPRHNTETLLQDCLKIGIPLLEQALELLIKEKAPAIKQDETQFSYAHKLEKTDGELLLEKHSAEQMFNIIRGCNPWPGAILSVNNLKLKIWQAQLCRNFEGNLKEKAGSLKLIKNELIYFTNDGALILDIVQPENKAKMSGIAFANGHLKQ